MTGSSLTEFGLVDLDKVDPTINLDIRYATADNFLGQVLYPVARALLHPTVAQQLKQVQMDLLSQGLSLRVYDAYRPLSVQRKMWEFLPDDRYIADPQQGSRHNRACAVDVTLLDSGTGFALDMGTAFDDFSEHSHTHYPGIPPLARANRLFLQSIMQKYGFTGLATEWWHFDAQNWQSYPILDIPLDSN
ncbi:MAG: D-alanyl-D-alanine dipeptidase [Cyanobacteriota bacterium]|nr:D-alanyl-D-alanine dipeptidase [Cyanobacteriota bacterium]